MFCCWRLFGASKKTAAFQCVRGNLVEVEWESVALCELSQIGKINFAFEFTKKKGKELSPSRAD